jgi:hypothetical protein
LLDRRLSRFIPPPLSNFYFGVICLNRNAYWFQIEASADLFPPALK